MKQVYHKITTIILVLLLLLVYTTSFVLATEDVDIPTEQGVFFVVSQETVKEGEQVTVSIVNHSGIAVTSGQFKITYDAERFDLLDKTVFGKEPMTFNQPEGETGTVEVLQYLLDAANPYAENVIASFTFQNKGTLSGKASFVLAKSIISYGAIDENPQKLDVQNDTVTLEVVNEDPEEIPSNEGTIVPEPTDPDKPIVPTGTSYLEPEPTESEMIKPSNTTTTEPTKKPTDEPTTAKPTTKPTDEPTTTKPTDITTESTASKTEPTDTIKTIDIQEAGANQTTERPSQTMTEPTKKTDISAPVTTEPNKAEGPVIPDDQGKETMPSKNETTLETIIITLTTKESIDVVESEPQKTMQILKLATEQSDQEQTEPINQAETSETKIAKQAVTTTSKIEATEQNSEMTKSMEQNPAEEKQAKQEHAFKLTGKDSDLNNKVIVGGLTLITLSSAIALGVMIFQNHIKPR